MKVFVSGQLDDTPFVKNVQNLLVTMGYEISHDWTASDSYLAGEIKDKRPEESALRSKNDIDGVLNCDVFVLCSNNKHVGKGMYVELGAAIALYEKTGRPKIYILGDLMHSSIFYYHPAVRHIKTVAELEQELKSATV